MSEQAHTQWMIDYWEDFLVRLVSKREIFSPQAQQRLDDLAALTRSRIRALKERLHQCTD